MYLDLYNTIIYINVLFINLANKEKIIFCFFIHECKAIWSSEQFYRNKRSRKVIYNDIYDISCNDARAIAEYVGNKADLYF